MKSVNAVRQSVIDLRRVRPVEEMIVTRFTIPQTAFLRTEEVKQ